MRHTKGKWVVIDSGGRVMLRAVGEPQIICTLEIRPLKITPEVQDNARLIAAAPDLLAALEGDEDNCVPNVPMILSRALLGDYEAVKVMLRELCSINAKALTKATG